MAVTRIFISGLGAVSPAGWGCASLLQGLEPGHQPLPQLLDRPGWPRPLSVLRVPPPLPRPAFTGHPRMRRASAISHFALGAAAEAVKEAGIAADGLGIVFCTTCGSVIYSRRFYEEVLRDPAVASPLLFPETVFNAPASHLAAVLGSAAVNYTLVGDTGVFLQGLVVAAGWLAEDRVQHCLVVAAEEVDWIVADVLHHFRKSRSLAEGAGALLLTRTPVPGTWAELDCVTDAVPYTPNRASARRQVLADLASVDALVDAACLGEGFAASTAWQAVAALAIARRDALPGATVVAAGAYQEAIGARFRRHSP